eukprot:COSAG03_NODE_429_length_7977_cov_3.949606_3_plen_90_part_00
MELAQVVRTEGFIVLRGVVDSDWVEECCAAFLPRLESHISCIGANRPRSRNRGPYRHYIDLPLVPPFVGITGCRCDDLRETNGECKSVL